METIRFNGSYAPKYKGNARIEFSRMELLSIVDFLFQGNTYARAARKFRTSKRVIQDIESLYHKTKGTFRRHDNRLSKLGSKTEEYYTEKELLQGIPEYKWEDLDNYEKYFYLTYGKEQRFLTSRKPMEI